jgi:hypothetical protein
MSKSAPVPPALRLAHRSFAFGGVALGLAAASAIAGLPLLPLGASALGAVWLWSGFVVRASWFGADALNRAWDATSRGRLVEAQTALDLASSRYQLAYIRQAIDFCLARVAFRRGDLPAALAHATAVVERRGLVLGRSYARAYRTNGRALRAVVRAAMGDVAGARDDAAHVRASPDTAPDALARAELAEAMVLERGGDRGALAEHLAAHRALLAEQTTPRERAIVRAYQRLVRAKPGSVYRKSAPRELPQSADEPASAEWIAQVAPAAAPFARRARATISARDAALEPADAELTRAAAARLTSRAAAAPRRHVGFVLGLWVALVGMFLAIWQVLAPGGGGAAAPDPATAAMYATYVPMVLMAVLFMAFLGLLASRLVRARTQGRRLAAAIRRAARGERALAERDLEPLAKSPLPIIAAQAQLHLALAAERRGAFADALSLCDRGLSAATGDATSRAVSSSYLAPELLAERALLLAATGRDAEASAEMAHVASAFPGFPLLARAERRFGVLSRVRRGDLAGAAALAGDDTCDAALPAPGDLLGEIARVLASPDGVSHEDVSAVKEALRDDPEARAWIREVAPSVLASFEAGGAARGDEALQNEALADPEGEVRREAEREAEAALEGASPAQRLVRPI